MGDVPRSYFVEVLRSSLAILRDADADHLLMGGLAAKAHLDERWHVAEEDIDIFIRERDAERVLARFDDAGYAVLRYDKTWIYKAARPNVTVDLIFRAGERIGLDDEHLARALHGELDGTAVPLPDPADLVVMKAVFDGIDRPGSWHTCVRLLERVPVDWDYLVRRSRAHAPDRLLSLLLYVASAGIPVPSEAISQLGRHVLDGRPSATQEVHQ